MIEVMYKKMSHRVGVVHILLCGVLIFTSGNLFSASIVNDGELLPVYMSVVSPTFYLVVPVLATIHALLIFRFSPRT